MLEELKAGCLRIGFIWLPKFVSMDFEIGAILAFEYSFPGILIIGCWFHFAQCLFKYLVDIGLKKDNGEDEKFAIGLCNRSFGMRARLGAVQIEFWIMTK